MNVILVPEDEQSLRKHVYEIVTEEIKRARKDSAVDKRILKQSEIAVYFGVSPKTIRGWEKLGLPYASMSEQSKFYDKEECRKWLLSQKR